MCTTAVVMAFQWSCLAADEPALASRNLEWAGVVISKIEKDLGDLSQKAGMTGSDFASDAVKHLRTKSGELKSALKFPGGDDDPSGAALDFSKMVNGLEQSLMDHMSDIDGRERDFTSFAADHSDIAVGVFAMKFRAEQASAASNLICMVAYEIGEKETERIKAEGAYRMDMLATGQLFDTMNDEADFVSNKSEMVDRNKERTKPVDLSRLDEARKRVRDAIKARQDVELEDAELEITASLVQQQRDRLNDKRGELDGQVSEARDSFNEVHDELNDAIDND